MRYYQLFEYNSSQTLTNYREPLESRLQTDSRAKDVLGTEPTPETVISHLEVQRFAVQNDSWAIEFVKNPSEKLQKFAVQQNGI